MEILSDIKSTSRFPPPFTCRTFLVQGMRIFIRLGSQLLTIVVVGLLVNKLFPTLHYTPISLPSSSVLFCRVADHTDTRPFVPGASLAHPPSPLPSVARCERLDGECDGGVCARRNETASVQTCPYSSDLLTEVSHCVFPWWAVLATIVPAIPYTILVYLEDNITSGLIEKPENNLKKGGPYDYLDTTITAVITLLMSCLGLPWVSAMYIRSFYHLQALSVIEDVYKPYGVFDERFIEVIETRVPGIVLGLLFYCVFFFDRALSVIPEAWDPTTTD